MPRRDKKNTWVRSVNGAGGGGGGSEHAAPAHNRGGGARVQPQNTNVTKTRTDFNKNFEVSAGAGASSYSRVGKHTLVRKPQSMTWHREAVAKKRAVPETTAAAAAEAVAQMSKFRRTDAGTDNTTFFSGEVDTDSDADEPPPPLPLTSSPLQQFPSWGEVIDACEQEADAERRRMERVVESSSSTGGNGALNNLHQEVAHFVKANLPTRAELVRIGHSLSALERVVQELLGSHAVVTLFGSRATCLSLRAGDTEATTENAQLDQTRDQGTVEEQVRREMAQLVLMQKDSVAGIVGKTSVHPQAYSNGDDDDDDDDDTKLTSEVDDESDTDDGHGIDDVDDDDDDVDDDDDDDDDDEFLQEDDDDEEEEEDKQTEKDDLVAKAEDAAPVCVDEMLAHNTETKAQVAITRHVEGNASIGSVTILGPAPSWLSGAASDIDAVILNVVNAKSTQKAGGITRKAERNIIVGNLTQLRRALNLSGVTKNKKTGQLIPSARVPLLKYHDIRTSCDVDLSMATLNGVMATQLVLTACRSHHALRPLIMCTKRLLREAEINDVVSGGVGSYGVFALSLTFIKGRIRHELLAGNTECKGLTDYGNMFRDMLLFYSATPPYFEVNPSDPPPIAAGGRLARHSAAPLAHPSRSEKLRLGNRNQHGGPKSTLVLCDPQDPSRNIGKRAHKWPWIQKAFSTAAAALIHGPYGWVPLEPVGLKVSYPSLKAAWDAVRNSVTAQVRQLEHGKRNKSGGKFAMENRGLSESTRKGKTKSGKQKGHNDRKSGQALHHVNQGGTSKKAAKRRRKKAMKQRVLRA